MMARGTSDRLARFIHRPTAAWDPAIQAHKRPSAPLKGISLPVRIGPVEFGLLGAMVALRCPSELAPLMEKAGGMWEPGSRRWLIQPRRIGPLIRSLHRVTDPLFRRAGINLDQSRE
jgi:hypothetical protein